MKPVSFLGSIALAMLTCALCWWLGEYRALPELRALAVPIGLLVGSIPVVAMKIRSRTRVAAHDISQPGAGENARTSSHTHPVPRGSEYSERVYERAFAWSVASVTILYAVALWGAWPAWVFGPGVLLAMLASYWVADLSTRGAHTALDSQHT